MSKYITRYCWECGEKQKHRVLRYDLDGRKRIVLGIFTLGLSELFNSKTVECCRCGIVNEVV